MTIVDWDAGRYERIAEELRPAARVVIETAAPRAHEHLLDIGCGTGNAALLAAARGAAVTGVDPAERLLELARAEARARGLDARFCAGDAERLPLADASVDVIVSVFGVVFAGDAAAAAREVARVRAEHGRIVLTAWLPEGPIAQVMRLRANAMERAGAAAAGPPPFAWHDREALRELFDEHRLELATSEHELELRAPSAADFLDRELHDHPAWIATREALGSDAAMRALRNSALEALEEANDSSDGFLVRSRYLVISSV